MMAGLAVKANKRFTGFDKMAITERKMSLE